MLLSMPLLLASLAPQAPETQKSVLRVYDVAPLLVPVDDGLFTGATAPPASSSLNALGDRPDGDHTNSAAILDAVYQLFEPELSYADRGLHLVGEDRLAARLPEPLQAELAGALAFLGDALRDTRTLTLRRYALGEGAGDPSTGTFGPDAWGALGDSLGAPTDTLTLSLRTGATGVLDLREARPFVGELNLEIASSSFAYDPEVLHALLGWRVTARAAAAEGGAWLAFTGSYAAAPRPLRRGNPSFRGVIAVSEPGPSGPGAPNAPNAPRRVESEEEPDRWFESLEILQRALAFRTFVPDGGGLALRLSAVLPAGAVDELWTLELSGGAPQVTSFTAAAAGRTLTLVDPGASARPEVLTDGDKDARTPLLRGERESTFGVGFRAPSPGLLQELLPGRARDWESLGGFLFRVSDEADLAEQVRAVLDPLCAGPAATAAVSVRATTPDGDVDRLDLPLAAGSQALAWIAQYQWLVSEANVEVAHYASARSGVATVVAEGLHAVAGGRPTADGWDLDLGVTAQRRLRDWRTLLLQDEHGGSLDLLDLATAGVAGGFRVGSGEIADLTGTGALTARVLPGR